VIAFPLPLVEIMILEVYRERPLFFFKILEKQEIKTGSNVNYN